MGVEPWWLERGKLWWTKMIEERPIRLLHGIIKCQSDEIARKRAAAMIVLATQKYLRNQVGA